jgi:Flp pilus assembly pilin Flp
MTVLYGLLARAQMWLASAPEERGQTFAEYAVIIGVLVVAVVAAVGTLRDAVISGLTTVASDI